MTEQFTLDLDGGEDTPQDEQETLAATPGDEAIDLDDEYSSFEDLHFNKATGG